MQSQLAGIIELAHQVHRQPAWDTRKLPDVLSAPVHFERGGDAVLGFSYINSDGKVIILNSAIEHTDHYVPVLAHECAHVIVEKRGTFACATDHLDHKEKVAWFGATLLAVPEKYVRKFLRGEASASEIAFACDVPYDFVALRVAVGEMVKARHRCLASATASHRLSNWLRVLRRSHARILARGT